MKVVSVLVLLMAMTVCRSHASVIPAAATTTYALASGPAVVTAQSHQVVARNYNHPIYAWPSYVPTVGAYPRYVYGSYPYGYGYGYTTTTPAVVPYGYYPSYTYRVW